MVVSILLYSTLHIGGIITPKQLSAVVMFVVCFSIEGRIETNKFLGLYLVFILFFGLSSLYTGYVVPFLEGLIGSFFIAYVAFWSTKILVYNYNDTKVFVRTLLIVGVIDAFITICQSYDIPIGNSILQYLHLSNSLDYLEEMNYESREFLELVLPGMFSSGVYNGYFLMTIGVISLSLIQSKVPLIGIFLWAFFALSTFLVQQRGPFFILIMISIVYGVKMIHSNDNIMFRIIFFLIFFIGVFLAVRRGYMIIFEGESRMANLGLNGTGRENIISVVWDYYRQRPLLGGYYQLTNQYHIAPHNVILNAFVYGGLVGGLALLLMLFRQLKVIFRYLKHSVNRNNRMYFGICYAFIAFTLNSFFHNKSVVTGDALIWMMWAVIYVNYITSRKNENLYSI